MNMKSKTTVFNLLILVSAMLAIFLDYHSSPWYMLLKPLTTILVILFVSLTKNSYLSLKRTLFIALCFCLLGDVLLLKQDYFVFGLGSFLIAHLLFARGFITLGGFQKNGIALVVLLIIGIALYAWLFPDLERLKYPVAAYVFVILFMVWQSIALYLKKKNTAFSLIAMGAILFMFSDAMIAIDKFKMPFEYSGVVILSTYWLAITLIANAGVIISNKASKET